MHAKCHLCKMLVTKIIWNTCKYIICCLGMGSRSEQKDKRLVPHMYTSYTYSLQVILFIYLCMSMCMHACMCTMCVPDAWGGQKWASEPLKLELWVVVSRHVGPLEEQLVFITTSHCSCHLGVISYNIFGASTFWLVLCTCIDFCSCGIKSVPKRVLDFFCIFRVFIPNLWYKEASRLSYNIGTCTEGTNTIVGTMLGPQQEAGSSLPPHTYSKA